MVSKKLKKCLHQKVKNNEFYRHLFFISILCFMVLYLFSYHSFIHRFIFTNWNAFIECCSWLCYFLSFSISQCRFSVFSVLYILFVFYVVVDTIRIQEAGASMLLYIFLENVASRLHVPWTNENANRIACCVRAILTKMRFNEFSSLTYKMAGTFSNQTSAPTNLCAYWFSGNSLNTIFLLRRYANMTTIRNRIFSHPSQGNDWDWDWKIDETCEFF